jgi:hypothetical protein
MLDIDPFLGDQIRAGGLGGLGGMPPPEAPSPAAMPEVPASPVTMRDQIRDGIASTAKALGIAPIDLATAISYETAGTFDPTKRGPTTQWGQHRGLIQFGVPQAKQHGVDWNDPIGSQLGENGAIASYLRSAGVKPGMGLLDIYSAINAGGVGLYNRTDANNGGAPGTVRDKVERQMAGHRAKAEALFGGGSEAPRDPMAFTAATRGGDVPPEFSRSLGQSQVPVSPMAGRIMAGFENPGANAMPDSPAPVRVASLGSPSVPPAPQRGASAGGMPPAAPRSMPPQGQPNMPMEDYTQGADRGVLAFALMNAGMQPVGGGEAVGGLGGLGGFRPPQPSPQAAPGPSGAPQGQQSPMPQQGQPSAPQQQPTIDDFLARAIPRVVPNPWALGGRALAENQQAEAQRQERMLTAKALIAKGIDPREAIAATANPQAMTQLMTQRRHDEQIGLEREKFTYQQKNDQETTTLRELARENALRAQRGEKPLSPLEFKAQIAKAGAPSINLGQDGQQYGNPGDGLAWKRDATGKVVIDERGAPVAIPFQGGKAYNDQAKNAKADAEKKNQTKVQGDIVVEDIDRSLKLMNEAIIPVAGGIGAAASKYLPGTNAADVGQLLTGIKANISFEKLSQMRAASPTGAALGSVSDRENVLLQSVLGSLDQSQSPAQFAYNMKRLKNVYLDIVHGPGNGPGREVLPGQRAPQGQANPQTQQQGGAQGQPRQWTRQELEAEAARRGLKVQ